MTIAHGANDTCLFCKIVAGSIPSNKVYEDDSLVAFTDIRPVAPVHLLIVPRKHIPSVADLERGDEGLIGEMVWRAKKIAEELNISEGGYRLLFNVRSHAGQVIDHLHLHLIGGRKLGPMA